MRMSVRFRSIVLAAGLLVAACVDGRAQCVNQSARGREGLQRTADSSDLFSEDRTRLGSILATLEGNMSDLWLPIKDWASEYWGIVEERSGGRLDVSSMKPPIEGVISAHGVVVDKYKVMKDVFDYVDRDYDSNDPKLPYKHDRERLRDAAKALVDAQWAFECKVRDAYQSARDRLKSLQGQVGPLYDQLAQATEQRTRAQLDLSNAFQENAKVVEEWSASFRRLAELDRECNDLARDLLREQQAERTDFRKVTDLENRITQLVAEAQRVIGRERTLRDQIRSAFDRIQGIEDRLSAAQNTEAETRRKLAPLEPDYERALLVNAGLIKVYRE